MNSCFGLFRPLQHAIAKKLKLRLPQRIVSTESTRVLVVNLKHLKSTVTEGEPTTDGSFGHFRPLQHLIANKLKFRVRKYIRASS